MTEQLFDLSTLKALVSSLQENRSHCGSKGPSTFDPSHSCKSLPSMDRSCNIIVFGIPESSLPNTRILIDKIFEYLSGRAMDITRFI